MILPYPSAFPFRRLDWFDWLERTWARMWRRSVIRMFGRWRSRWARCRICGQQFAWTAAGPAPCKCPACAYRFDGMSLGQARIVARRGR